MRISSTLAAIIAASLFVVGMKATPAQNAGAVRRTLQRLYNQESSAAEHMNVAGILADLDKNFVSIGNHGERRDYAFMQSNANRMVEIGQAVSASATIRTCTIKGDTATAVVFSKTTVSFRQPGDQKMSKDIASDLSQDTWVRSGGRWRMTKSVDMESKETMQGPAATHPNSNLLFAPGSQTP